MVFLHRGRCDCLITGRSRFLRRGGSFANADVAARKLVEIANTTEPAQEGIVNAAFLKANGTPDQFRAALDRAIEKRWLERHESGTYVKFTHAGAELFA